MSMCNLSFFSYELSAGAQAWWSRHLPCRHLSPCVRVMPMSWMLRLRQVACNS